MKVKYACFIVALLTLSGCAATPPAREIDLPNQVLSESLNDESKIKVIVYNDSNKLLYGIDNSGKINIHLNGKGVGQLKIGQYVVLAIEKGEHAFDLLHRDLVNFSSSHKINFTESPTYLKIFAKVTSNGAEIVEKPENFEEKFKAAF